MKRILILKEIKENIINLKFIIFFAFCITLMPITVYISLKQNKQDVDNYNEEVKNIRSNTKIGPSAAFIGIKPVSPGSIFTSGTKLYSPHKVITHPDGYAIEMKSTYQTKFSKIFGKLDFVFILSNVVSLLVLFFAFDLITAEKENGTMKLMLMNSISRFDVVTSKIAGAFLLIMIPIILSFIITALLITILNPNIFQILIFKYLIFFITTSLFLFLILTLTILISIISKSSIISISVSLVIWISISFLIPKLSPIVIENLFPTKSNKVVEIEKFKAKKYLNDELRNHENKLFTNILRKYDLDAQNLFQNNQEINNAKSEFDSIIMPIRAKYQNQIVEKLSEIDKENTNKIISQSNNIQCFNRISFYMIYISFTNEIFDMGNLELNNFRFNAENFQMNVTNQIYSNWYYKSYNVNGMQTGSYELKAGKKEPKQIPQFTYTTIGLSQIIQYLKVDFIVFISFIIVIIISCYTAFLKYDVR